MFKLIQVMSHKRMELDPLHIDSFIKYCINDLNLPIVGLCVFHQ